MRADIRARNQDSDCEVWPEHWHAVQVFCALSTQWHVQLGMQGLHYQGLRYEAIALVEPLIEREADHGTPGGKQHLAAPAMFACLQIMEREALKHLNAAH